MIKYELDEREKNLQRKENIIFDLIIGILLAIAYLMWKIATA
jgi:hypothetical protein